MFIKKIVKTKIVHEVTVAIESADKSIYATMLLAEELKKPLPQDYHDLIKKKTSEGVRVYRVGFGTRGEYNELTGKFNIPDSRYYFFSHSQKIVEYQRMLCVDEKKLFFGVDGSYFTSEYKPLVKVFIQYFKSRIKQ